MAYTKTILQRSSTRNTVKIVAAAQTDTATIFLKSTVTLGATSTIAFALPTAGNGGTITRTSGSWITDYTSATFANGGGLNVLGQIVYVAGAGADTTNQKHYSIIGMTATVLTVSVMTPVMKVESGLTVTSSAYYSDLLCPGQTIPGTPSANITNAWASTLTTGGAILTRNSVITIGLYGGGGDYGSKPPCIPLAENNTNDIVVTWQTGSSTGGALVVEMSKMDGFSGTDVGAY